MKARNIIILPSNNGNKKYIRNNNNGINEGLSRTLSQGIQSQSKSAPCWIKKKQENLILN